MDFHRIKNILIQHTLTPDEWKGAVLFLCNAEHVFLIKRAENMPTHGGQIAFVGGHKLQHEDDPWEVAQREFEEETHHSRSCLDFMGYLPLVMAARNQPIVPVMGKLLISTETFLKEVKSNGEWDEILAYPWAQLTQEKSWDFGWRHGEQAKHAVLFHTIKAGSYLPREQSIKPHLLWGATANMIWSFLSLYFKS
jgi:8-oxo-dGTP pyrophosphatase MutT (NUDIX family)